MRSIIFPPLLAYEQGVTVQANAENQLKGIGFMNNIKAQAEEAIVKGIVYARR